MAGWWLLWFFLLLVVGLMAAMTGAWLVQRMTKNAGWVDVIWTVSTGVFGVLAALVPWPGQPPASGRAWLVAILAALWSARLAWHIAERTAGKPEDVRYAGFRQEWGADYERRMFWFLMIQAGAAALLVLSILAAARHPGPLDAADGLGALVFAIAIAGETLADWQMRQFREQVRREGRHGAVCDTGLWAWSRHPNYFFEWLVWCAYPLLAIDLAGDWWPGWLALIGPVFMFWLLRYVSGVPPLEAAMLRSRGDAFRAYQARVSAFVPWPPSKA